MKRKYEKTLKNNEKFFVKEGPQILVAHSIEIVPCKICGSNPAVHNWEFGYDKLYCPNCRYFTSNHDNLTDTFLEWNNINNGEDII